MQWRFHKSRWKFISTEVSNLEAVRSSTLSKLNGKQCKNGVLPLTHNCMCDLLERGHFRENKSSRYWKGPAGCSPANPISRLISIPPLEHFNAVSLSACLFGKPGAVTWEGEEREGVMEHLQVALFQESASYFTNKRTPGWLASPKRHALKVKKRH